MLAEVGGWREQARTVPKLEHAIQMELIARLLGEFEFVVADQERRAYTAIGGFHLGEALMGVLCELQDV